MKRTFFRDILRDTNSLKFSMTKFAGLTTLILLVISVLTGIIIMIVNWKIDHILIGELIALLLTLLGFKNYNSKNKTSGNKLNKSGIESDTDVISDKLG